MTRRKTNCNLAAALVKSSHPGYLASVDLVVVLCDEEALRQLVGLVIDVVLEVVHRHTTARTEHRAHEHILCAIHSFPTSLT